jgi:hypothetical protein
LGNTIQLQGFDGCDSVEADSPIEHHPGRTGERMLTLRGEHFYFTENIGVICEIGVLRALWRALSASAADVWGLETRLGRTGGLDFARKWHSGGGGDLPKSGELGKLTHAPPGIAYDGQLAVNHK